MDAGMLMPASASSILIPTMQKSYSTKTIIFNSYGEKIYVYQYFLRCFDGCLLSKIKIKMPFYEKFFDLF